MALEETLELRRGIPAAGHDQALGAAAVTAVRCAYGCKHERYSVNQITNTSMKNARSRTIYKYRTQNDAP